MNWKRSNLCGGGSCLEVLHLKEYGALAVRNSNKVHVKLGFTEGVWREFIEEVKNGEFDHLAQS